MINYIKPHQGHVVDGLEHYEVEIAKTQSEYLTVRALVSSRDAGNRVMRFCPDEAARRAIANGADIYVDLLTFNHPMNPIRLMVMSDTLAPEEFNSLADELGWPDRKPAQGA